jgi:hypothetical protein
MEDVTDTPIDCFLQISVKNFRMINLKLSWTRIVLLATCSKTSITVKSFSLVDSK